MADRVNKRGGIIVTLVVLAVVIAAVVLALGRDNKRSTPVEDAVAGREATSGVPDAGGASAAAQPQGREAPDSNEGIDGAGTETLTRGLADPEANPNAQAELGTGRNAPADPRNQAAQRTPRNDLRNGANADPERSDDPR